MLDTKEQPTSSKDITVRCQTRHRTQKDRQCSNLRFTLQNNNLGSQCVSQKNMFHSRHVLMGIPK